MVFMVLASQFFKSWYSATMQREGENMTKEQIYLLIGTVVSWSFGWLGADRFYKGDIGLGILKLFTLGGLGVWYVVDAALWTKDLGMTLAKDR
jgi:hypothetical protein